LDIAELRTPGRSELEALDRSTQKLALEQTPVAQGLYPEQSVTTLHE